MEGAEVERHVGPQFRRDPAGERVDLGFAVVLAGDQERRDLDPHPGLALQIKERIEHRLELAAA